MSSGTADSLQTAETAKALKQANSGTLPNAQDVLGGSHTQPMKGKACSQTLSKGQGQSGHFPK